MSIFCHIHCFQFVVNVMTAVVDPDLGCEPRFGLSSDTYGSVDLDPDPKPEELRVLSEGIEAPHGA